MIIDAFLTSMIVFSAFLVLGLTGFGSGVIMMSLLLLFLDIKLVVPSLSVLNIVIYSLLVLRSRRSIRKGLIPAVLLGALIGATFGTYVLATYESPLLKRIFGLFVILFALNMLFDSGKRKNLRLSNPVGFLAGAIGGLISAVFGMGGPPVVIYFAHRIRKKEALRATLLFYFLLVTLWKTPTYLYAGLIDLNVIKFSAFLLPSSVIGIILGSKIHVSISETTFRSAVVAVLLATGFLNLAII